MVFEIPDDAQAAFEFTPGQFLTLAVPSTETGIAARCYSLSSAPHTGIHQITVKRTADGYASNWICDNLSAGDTIRVLPPSGIFTPKDLNADFLLFAAGSGITPGSPLPDLRWRPDQARLFSSMPTAMKSR
ncbi:MAG: FAD-binding oxidoreductase [Marmoricola sp.]